MSERKIDANEVTEVLEFYLGYLSPEGLSEELAEKARAIPAVEVAKILNET